MKVLLLAMPDSADVIDYFIRFPNLGIASLAGSLARHDAKILDLVLYRPNIRQRLKRVLADFRPDVVGLSAMTFQFDTLLRVARLVREFDPDIRLVAGGYHVTLLARELTASKRPVPLDFLVRGEGEATIQELLDELAQPTPDLGRIRGLSYRNGNGWAHNPDRPLLDADQVPLPRRQARLAGGFYLLGSSVDVAETSRGCPFDCKFCSIKHMYGQTFRPFSPERVIADLQSIRSQGTRGVFFADDNITYDAGHFRAVCDAIVQSGLNDLFYATQVSATGIARDPGLVTIMARANFRIVFVGFESMDPARLKHMKKPASPDINVRAAALLRQHNMAVVAGCIVGHPEDTAASVARQYRMIVKLRPDVIYAQYLTPYPKTPLREELLAAGLVANERDFSTYDGFSCNIRTRHLSRRALYRALKKEAVRAFFTPALSANNYFLKNYRLPFLRAAGKAFLTNVFNVVAARQRVPRMGI